MNRNFIPELLAKTRAGTLVVKNGPAKKKNNKTITVIKSGSRKSSSPRMAGDGPVRELACSVTDPFNCSACIPDGSTNTGCFSIKQMHTLGTGATGSCCSLMICPDVDSFSISDSGSNAATVTVPANWTASQAQATISGQYQQVRPVSAGISVSFVGNTQTDQGVILIGQVSSGTGPNNLAGLGMGGCANRMLSYKTFPLRAGGRITWRPEDFSDQSEWFNCGAGPISTAQAVAVPWLFVGVFGCNVNTAITIQCEVVVNFEGQFKLLTFIPGGIQTAQFTKVPAVVGWYEKAKAIYNKIEPYFPLLLSFLGQPNAAAAMQMGNGYKYALTSGRGNRSV